MRSAIIIFSLIFTAFFVSAQEMQGVVLTEEEFPMENVLIINMKTGEKHYTNREGKFSFSAKLSEEIRLVKKGYDRITYIIKNSDFGQRLSFKMKKSEIQVDEVVITKVSKAKMESLQKSLGVPQVTWKVREKGKAYTAKDALLPLLMGGVNIQALNDLATGESRRRRNLYQYEDFQEKVDWIKKQFGVEFFIEKGIPEERISEFIGFAITEKSEMDQLIKRKNFNEIEKRLESVLPIYLERLKAN
ncbi:MAG: hypothetical protein Q4A00_03040 [Flavobacteriaceae bacterium]|nr:hypothetical protein [Flavobacteriaceae bacterium]